MRITIVTETYAPQVNGVSMTLGQLVRALEAAGDVVQLIHPDYGLPPDRPEVALVTAIRMPFYREIRLPLPFNPQVRRAIERFEPDLVHIATEATLGLSALRAANRRRIPTVSSFHTNFDAYSAHYRVGWSRGLIWRYLRWFHNRTLETYVPSNSTRDALQRRGFRNLTLWPRGVDAGVFRPDRPRREAIRHALGIGPDEVAVAYVGRLAAEKNIDYLAEALEIARGRSDRIVPLIVGDGPERPMLEGRLGEAARFVGFRSGMDLADHYAAADLFAFASRTETFGNVVLEAMATALPVIVLAEGGPADLVESGINGLAIDPEAPPEAFAEAIVGLANDPARREGMAEHARKAALSRTWAEVMAGLRSSYVEVLRARDRRQPAPTG